MKKTIKDMQVVEKVAIRFLKSFTEQEQTDTTPYGHGIEVMERMKNMQRIPRVSLDLEIIETKKFKDKVKKMVTQIEGVIENDEWFGLFKLTVEKYAQQLRRLWFEVIAYRAFLEIGEVLRIIDGGLSLFREGIEDRNKRKGHLYPDLKPAVEILLESINALNDMYRRMVDVVGEVANEREIGKGQDWEMAPDIIKRD